MLLLVEQYGRERIEKQPVDGYLRETSANSHCHFKKYSVPVVVYWLLMPKHGFDEV